MKVFSVIGTKESGKTTTIENIIKELKKRRYSVGSVKEIHYEKFAIDKEGTNTYRHRAAGAEVITARGYYETDILFPRKLSMEEVLRFYDQDFVVLESVTDYNLPKILCAYDGREVDGRLDRSVFVISGKISNSLDKYKDIPVINAIKDSDKLVNLIEEKVYKFLPDFSSKCCDACGYSCRELGMRILEGKSKREDCIISEGKVDLLIDGRKVKMVPFVQRVLYSTVLAVVKNLKGYRKGKSIEVKISGV